MPKRPPEVLAVNAREAERRISREVHVEGPVGMATHFGDAREPDRAHARSNHTSNRVSVTTTWVGPRGRHWGAASHSASRRRRRLLRRLAMPVSGMTIGPPSGRVRARTRHRRGRSTASRTDRTRRQPCGRPRASAVRLVMWASAGASPALVRLTHLRHRPRGRSRRRRCGRTPRRRRRRG